MKNHFVVYLYFSLLCLLVLFVYQQVENSNTSDTGTELRIAYSQVVPENPWLTSQINSLSSYLESHNYTFIYHEPISNSLEWQLSDIHTILESGVDYLILSPIQSSGFQSVIDLAREKGTKIILVETMLENCTAGTDYLTFIGSSLEEQSQVCAAILAENAAGDNYNVLEICSDTQFAQIDVRSQSFADALSPYDNIQILQTAEGCYDRITTQTVIQDILIEANKNGIKINGIFAHDDEAGLGALSAVKLAGLKPSEIQIISINGEQDAIKAILAQEYCATIRLDSTIGAIVDSVISRNESSFRAPPYIFISHSVIDEDNALEKLQDAY